MSIGSNLTWKFTSSELNKVIEFLWEEMKPDTSSFVHNTAALPVIKSPHSLTYQDFSDNDTLLICDLPTVLKSSENKSNDTIPCCICKKDSKLCKMHNHVGYHILHKL